jgi:hypothetical protein
VAGVNYRFAVTEAFWENFYKLPSAQKEATRAAWGIFKANPFDARLGAHRIHRLSTIMRRTVYAVEIGADLRALFYIEGDAVVSFNIGSHDIYKA